MQTQTPLLESAGLTSDCWLSFFSLMLKKVEMFLVLESGKSMTLLNSYICRPFLLLETYENINCPKQAKPKYCEKVDLNVYLVQPGLIR